MSQYSFTLDPAELARYDAMAAHALNHEARLWDTAGITAGAAVVDLGCGPGAFLAALGARTARSGTVVGVDEAAAAVDAARALVEQRGLRDTVRIVHAAAQHTGLDPASFDVVFIRNLLVHNGPAAEEILNHARDLLRPTGHLLCVEPDITGLRLPEAAADERELEWRWTQMTRSLGNDPSLGSEDRLATLVSAAGFILDNAERRIDTLAVERSPAWTARQMMLDKGFATNADLARWDTAITTRLRDIGPLACELPLTAVLAHPGPITTTPTHHPGRPART